MDQRGKTIHFHSSEVLIDASGRLRSSSLVGYLQAVRGTR